MLGTARVLGQTLGTAMVAVLFHLSGNQGGGEVVCLWVALGLALVSGILSASRLKEDSPLQKKA
jgi:DHA2 family multidrug resistance protein-like MFS transporter